MLTYQEKSKIKDILSDGLGIRKDINLAYFLNRINETGEKVDKLESQLNIITNNQKILDKKIDMIINMLKQSK